MEENINREVLGEVINDLTEMVNALTVMSKGEHEDYDTLDLMVVENILTAFIGRTKGSYYHYGRDGYLARLAN